MRPTEAISVARHRVAHADDAAAHHERLDGSGYPDGLRGDAVPLLAQIMGVVDVFDALTTSRPYKATLSVEQACDVLRDEVRCGWRRGSSAAR